MKEKDLLPDLFRSEFRKLTAVLCKSFGIQHIEIAEDIVSDTFLLAAETWKLKGTPDNPTAWLYVVSKNKTKDYFKRHQLFTQKISPSLQRSTKTSEEILIDLSEKNIKDSQLQMMFAICHPSIPVHAQIGLSLRILCAFGIEEIADAFLTTKENINKRLFRAKKKLKEVNAKMDLPSPSEIDKRLETVLTTIYLLFNQGYYSSTQNITLQKDLCFEAMRLNHLLIENSQTNTPTVNALLSLMCFHASRFEARVNSDGEIVLYEEQDTNLWNQELIDKGELFLNLAASGHVVSKFHLEAAIAYWHTSKQYSSEKWEHILQLYNQLLQIEYSPIAALNRTYALSKASGKRIAIVEAEKLNLENNHFYHSLLGNLYTSINITKSLHHYQAAFKLAKTKQDKHIIQKNMDKLNK